MCVGPFVGFVVGSAVGASVGIVEGAAEGLSVVGSFLASTIVSVSRALRSNNQNPNLLIVMPGKVVAIAEIYYSVLDFG